MESDERLLWEIRYWAREISTHRDELRAESWWHFVECGGLRLRIQAEERALNDVIRKAIRNQPPETPWWAKP
jgi:hypothetical protein